jgi:uncharacterized membrane protein YqjE
MEDAMSPLRDHAAEDLRRDRPNGDARHARPSIAGLVSRLVQDFKELIAHEVRLAREEIRQELAKARTAAVGTAAAVALGALAGLMLLLTLVHVLHEIAGLPLWASYGIMALLLFAGAAALLWRARRAAADFHMVPVHTAQTVKENMVWLKEQATSPRS